MRHHLYLYRFEPNITASPKYRCFKVLFKANMSRSYKKCHEHEHLWIPFQLYFAVSGQNEFARLAVVFQDMVCSTLSSNISFVKR